MSLTGSTSVWISKFTRSRTSKSNLKINISATIRTSRSGTFTAHKEPCSRLSRLQWSATSSIRWSRWATRTTNLSRNGRLFLTTLFAWKALTGLFWGSTRLLKASRELTCKIFTAWLKAPVKNRRKTTITISKGKFILIRRGMPLEL